MSVLRNISFFLATSVLSKPLGFLLSFALARSLGPENFGVWLTLLLIISYSPIVSLGSVETLLKEIPYFLGRREPVRVQEVEESVMGSIILSAVTMLFFALAALIILPKTSFGIEPSLVVMLLIAAAIGCFSGFYYNRLAAYENFKAAGTMDFIRSALALVLIVGMSWQWGLKGAATGYLLHEISVCCITAYINYRHHGEVGVSFSRKLLVHNVSVGFPITLLWWTLTLTSTVDRIVLGSLLGPMAVGHYGLGVSLTTIPALVPMVVGRVLYPKINMHFGGGKELKSMIRLVLNPTLALGIILANLLLFIVIVMPLLYNYFLPKYQTGLLAGQILMLGSFFACLLRNGANYLIAANQERVFLKYIVVTLVLNVAADVGFVRLGLGLEGIALGTSLAGLLLTTLVWRKVLLELEFLRRQLVTTLFNLYLPIIVIIAAFIILIQTKPAIFRTLDSPSVFFGVGLFFLLNCLLYCVPVYREEMHSWIKTMSKIKAYSTQLIAVAGKSD